MLEGRCKLIQHKAQNARGAVQADPTQSTELALSKYIYTFDKDKNLLLELILMIKLRRSFASRVITNSVALVRERTIPTERPPLVEYFNIRIL
jgi:hypothetical protein